MRGLELRADLDGGGPGLLTGPVVVYGDLARVRDEQSGQVVRERIAARAFQGWGNVPVTLQHEREAVITDVESGGLSLTDGPHQLRAQVRLPDTALGRLAANWVERGTLSGFSAAFVPETETPEPDGGRRVQRGQLLAVGLVDVAAYPQSRVLRVRQDDGCVVTWCTPLRPRRGQRGMTQRPLLQGLPHHVGQAPWWMR
ncbi:MAG: hypothetical protein F4037_13425 [Gemmatimonadales bacterium]|nr:hypothetical protein [Candidatus Palauibacter ramosifaciens]